MAATFRVFAQGHTSVYIAPEMAVEVDHPDGTVDEFAASGGRCK
jgi:hypothetical protein